MEEIKEVVDKEKDIKLSPPMEEELSNGKEEKDDAQQLN